MGMPGVFAFGTFDTWSPGYLMFIAATHNGISRLYETFGNGGSADTQDRTLSANETSRTWYRQNPPLPRVQVVAAQQQQLRADGPARLAELHREQPHVLPAQLLREEQALDPQGEDRRARRRTCCRRPIRVSARRPSCCACCRSSASRSRARRRRSRVQVPARAGRRRAAAAGGRGWRWRAGGAAAQVRRCRRRRWRAGGGQRRERRRAPAPPAPRTETREFPAGSYIIRMDQPYSRIADALLDYQYWAPNDPQTTPYDDTGWTFPEGVRRAGRARARSEGARRADDARQRRGRGRAAACTGTRRRSFAINHNADNALDHAALQAQGRGHPDGRRAVRSRGRRSSTAARSSSRNVAAGGSRHGREGARPQGVRARRGADGQDASGARGARRADAHVAEHADRRLVAAGVRLQRHAVRLHQRAGRREEREPARRSTT